MNHKNRPIQALVVIGLLVIFSAYFITTQVLSEKNGALTASGTIEAVQVNISPEISGKVRAVAVEEGQNVSKGDTLFELDPTLLNAQREVAAAALNVATAAFSTAQTNLDLSMQNALSQQQTLQAKNWRFSAPDEFNQPGWYFEEDEQLNSARLEVEAAKTALDQAQTAYAEVQKDLNNADFIAAEERLSNARASFLIADTVKINADYAAEGGALQKSADKAYNAALDELRAAQSAYGKMLDTQSADIVENARGAMTVAQQRYDAAYARYASLQTGLNSPAVLLAQKALHQAESAQQQAQANLALIDNQIAKMTIVAPGNGMVLTRNIESGEFLQTGSTALVIGQVDDLTITVYVPENRYGEIFIGQPAKVTVDSFPGLIFSAEVIQVGQKAEFTPRNVQTVEGRSSTVYAIKLKLNNPEGKLKIGMPADVVFVEQ